jgi:hypothetical protein
MGLFKKAKQNFEQGQQHAAEADAMRQAYQQQQAAGAAAGQVGVEGMAADPAAFGGPSTEPLDADDPMLQPTHGVSLEQYAEVAKACRDKGVTDEAGMGAVAEADFGIPAGDMIAASQEWTRRMQQSMVVGQQFNRLFLG